MDYLQELHNWQGIGLIDIRERPNIRDSIRRALENEGLRVGVDVLPAGDIILLALRKVGIERKTADDLINSITGGGRKGVELSRLADELLRLRQETDVAVLMIEGRLWCDGEGMAATAYGASNLRWSSLSSALLSVQHSGIVISLCPNQRLMPQHVVSIHRYYLKEEHTFMLPSNVPSIDPDPAVAVLSSIPGIGHDKAVKLLTYYLSLDNVIRSIDTWVKVKGIGKETVKSAKDVFYTPYAQA